MNGFCLRRSLVFLLLPLSLTAADRLVTVNAIADPGYAQRRSASGEPEVESYVIAKGQRMLGAGEGLRKIPFKTIAAGLAPDLLQRNYRPAATVDAANLVIVVHWGITGENESDAALLQYDPDTLRVAAEAVTEAREREQADTTGLARTLGVAAAAEASYETELRLADSLYRSNERMAFSNAELLGFKSALNRDDDLGETLRGMLNEERYFVVLIAYDAKSLSAGKKQQLWITRLSIRAAGINFPTALDRMSAVGAHFHGTRQPSIILLESPKRRGELPKVDQVILIGDTPEPAAKKKK